ncbi:MAG: GNAT family N-acetyltransferase [Balneolaceae bacterium]
MKVLSLVEADFDNPTHAKAVVDLTNAYAQDSMGLNDSLPNTVKNNLIAAMKAHGNTFSFLAYMDDVPAGVANCYLAFSTFCAANVLNIHDIAVSPYYRNKGIGDALLSKITEKANALECCKITLEVRKDNPAQHLYLRNGFEFGSPPMYFMSKPLNER